jgi:hypothetical protein
VLLVALYHPLVQPVYFPSDATTRAGNNTAAMDRESQEKLAAGVFPSSTPAHDADTTVPTHRAAGVVAYIAPRYGPFVVGFVCAAILAVVVYGHQPMNDRMKRGPEDEAFTCQRWVGGLDLNGLWREYETDAEGCRYTALARLRRVGAAN